MNQELVQRIETKLHINHAFMRKASVFKITFNDKKETYFHLGKNINNE